MKGGQIAEGSSRPRTHHRGDGGASPQTRHLPPCTMSNIASSSPPAPSPSCRNPHPPTTSRHDGSSRCCMRSAEEIKLLKGQGRRERRESGAQGLICRTCDSLVTFQPSTIRSRRPSNLTSDREAVVFNRPEIHLFAVRQLLHGAGRICLDQRSGNQRGSPGS